MSEDEKFIFYSTSDKIVRFNTKYLSCEEEWSNEEISFNSDNEIITGMSLYFNNKYLALAFFTKTENLWRYIII